MSEKLLEESEAEEISLKICERIAAIAVSREEFKMSDFGLDYEKDSDCNIARAICYAILDSERSFGQLISMIRFAVVDGNEVLAAILQYGLKRCAII